MTDFDFRDPRPRRTPTQRPKDGPPTNVIATVIVLVAIASVAGCVVMLAKSPVADWPAIIATGIVSGTTLIALASIVSSTACSAWHTARIADALDRHSASPAIVGTRD